MDMTRKQMNEYDPRLHVSPTQLEYMNIVARWLKDQKMDLIGIVRSVGPDNPNNDSFTYTVRVIKNGGEGDMHDMVVRASWPTSVVVLADKFISKTR